MKKLNLKEKNFHERVNGNIEQCFEDHREIIHLERLFEDRVKGAIGLRIIGIKTTSEYFLLLCSDEKNKRAIRIYLTHSQYGDTLRLTATEVIFQSTGKKQCEKTFKKAEEIKKHQNIAKVIHQEQELGSLVTDMGKIREAYLTARSKAKDGKKTILNSEIPEDVKEKLVQIWRKHETSKKGLTHSINRH